MAMKNKLFVFIGIIFLLTGSLTAKEPLKDYSFVRGVCHNLTPDQETLDRDLGLRGEIRKFAYDLALQLKKWCELF